MKQSFNLFLVITALIVVFALVSYVHYPDSPHHRVWVGVWLGNLGWFLLEVVRSMVSSSHESTND